MNNNNGCADINCPFLTDCPYIARPSCFTPAKRHGEDEGTIEKAFQIGFQLGLMKDCGYADFVPVVRCKDCIYAREHDVSEAGNTLVCSYSERLRYVRRMDYCSHGRRKELKTDE